MRIKNKIMAPVMAGLMLTFTFFSCVDEIKFGNAFWKKRQEDNKQKIRFSIVLSIPNSF